MAVILLDGSFYVGWITAVNERTLTLAGRKGIGKVDGAALPRLEKASINAFFPGNPGVNAGAGAGLGNPFGFSPAAAARPAGGGPALGGLGGIFGFMKGMWSKIQIGMGIVKMVMPLLGGLKL